MRAGSIGAVHPLGNDALSAEMARKGEHRRPIPGDVFVGQDAGFEVAQQLRQRSLAVKQRPTAQILAIKLDQVEGVEDRSSRNLPEDGES
jgi:hypothetical protein